MKVLGSLLGDHQDMQRRKRQATIAFCIMMTLWFHRHHVSEPRQIRLYKAYVDGRTLCWLTTLAHGAIPKVNVIVWTPSTANNCNLSLASLSRSHLQQLWTYILWTDFNNGSPHTMELFWHILRLPPTVPATKAMTAYFSQPEACRCGRPGTKLPTVPKDNLKAYQLQSKKDLQLLRTKAQAQGE